MMGLALAVVAALVAVSRLMMGWVGRRHATRWRQREPYSGSWPHVSVIAPRRGRVGQENIDDLLSQDYEGTWDIIFVTTQEDASHDQLREHEAKHRRVRLTLARDVVQLAQEDGIHRGQKCENLLTAIAAASTETEIFACIDADVWPSRDWLRSLVEPLLRTDTEAEATTLSRLYPPGPGLASNIQTAWLIGGAGLLLGPSMFTWGGSCAFRRSMLDKTDVLRRWQGLEGPICCDDLNLSVALRKGGHRICYVPGPMAMRMPPEQEESLSTVLHFTNRQLLHAWWAQRDLFWHIFVPTGLETLSFLAALCVVWWQPLAALALSLPLIDILSLWGASLRLESMDLEGRIPPGSLRKAVLKGGAYGSLLATINCLTAMATTRMNWGGVEYTPKTVIGYTENDSWRAKTRSTSPLP